jgi:secondary thiamine-phosphate synthase enzyme
MNTFTLQTRSRTDFVQVDQQVSDLLAQTGFQEGVVTVFIPHTTAGIMINENADPDVLLDLETIFDRVVPWEKGYRHLEGNAAAHAKAAMVGSSVQIIFSKGRLQLGTWQSLYFCEFDGPRTRKVWVTFSEGTVSA